MATTTTSKLELSPVPAGARRASYRDITGPAGKLAELQPFAGNSMHAHRYQDRSNRTMAPCAGGQLPAGITVPADAVYVVWSYATPIAWCDSAGVVTVPAVSYSRTTTRQQNACRAWLAAAVHGTTTHAHHVSESYRSCSSCS